MKTNYLLRVIVVINLTCLGGYGAYQLGMHQGMQKSGNSTTPSEQSSLADMNQTVHGRKILYWHDPMVPSQKFDKPGKSPFMDMQLEPVYADEGDDGSQVTVSARTQQNLGVRLAEVTQGSLAPVINVVGNVAYNDRDVTLVQARANGFIEKLYVRAPLDPVRKGQALAELYVPDWVAAQEEFLTVRKMGASVSEGLLDGARQRMRLAGMSDDQIKQVESSGKTQTRLTIYAPSGGVVSELDAREGMTVMAGAPLFRINGIGSVWVNAEVPENMTAQIHLGDLVEVRSPALSNTVLKGRVNALLPQINATTRTMQARIELANPHGSLVPDMFVNVSFSPSETSQNILIVPSEAIIQTGQRSVVMVAQGEGKFTSVDVETGVENNGMTEITKGLHVGQKVVSSGQFLIDSEASLRGTTIRMGNTETSETDQSPMPMTYHGKGKIEAIGKDDITLSHDPIPNLHWGAMTMGFKLPAHGLPKNIAVGDTVTFSIQPTPEGEYQITAISPINEMNNMTEMKR